jgi:c-di-GMP phosphodiesterase
LLYRRAHSDGSAHFVDADRASAEVLLEAFLDIGLATVSAVQPVFINHTTALLAMDPIVPKDRCVIEVLEDVPVNEETIASLERLHRLGYRIALDDFVYSEEHIPFLKLAHYAKLDVRTLEAGQFASHVERMKRFQLKVVAEKVETEEEFRRCKELGCDLFQGYYLRKPEVLRGRRIPANRLSALSLLAECVRADQSPHGIAAVISRDAALIYGLLRLANSALYGRPNAIRSPLQAVMLLGMDRVFRWASLLVLSGYDDCPAGYLGFALERARACELLANSVGRPPQVAYLAGLLSTLDAILNAPLEDILRPLPLDDRFKGTILVRDGEMGAILDAVLDYQAGNFETAAGRGIPIEHLQGAYWEAVQYSATMLAELRQIAA